MDEAIRNLLKLGLADIGPNYQGSVHHARGIVHLQSAYVAVVIADYEKRLGVRCSHLALKSIICHLVLLSVFASQIRRQSSGANLAIAFYYPFVRHDLAHSHRSAGVQLVR